MADNCSRKLMVEICNARNLMPKDGQGTASAYVIVDFDGQRRRTKTKFRDLNPQWDEKLEFLVHDPDSMASEILELNIYNDKKTGRRTTFLGKIKISGSSFAKSGSETLVYYPLEKRSVFSQIKGEMGLKVYYVDEDPPAPDTAATTEQKSEAPAAEEKPAAKEEEKKDEEKKEEQKPAAANEEKPPEDAKPAETPAAVAAPPSEPVENTQIAQTDNQKQQKEKAVATKGQMIRFER